jgi:hypothetical protein
MKFMTKPEIRRQFEEDIIFFLSPSEKERLSELAVLLEDVLSLWDTGSQQNILDSYEICKILVQEIGAGIDTVILAIC